MKKTIGYLLLILLIMPVTAGASTYLWFWVNGDTAHTITQGDDLAWELDLASVGNSVSMDLYLDLNASRTIDAGDYLLETFTITDGAQDDGPQDSSAVPDGLIYLRFGSFGFAPQNYILHATDEDQSPAENWFEMKAMSDPPATVYGSISIEGTAKPDAKYENIMIAAMGENGLFSGLTDANGDYSINLSVADAFWEIGFIFEDILPGYIRQQDGYNLSVPAGNTGPLNFTFGLPSAYIYGTVYDQDGLIIDRDGYVGIENQTTGTENYVPVTGGKFQLPVLVEIQGSDSVNTIRLRTEESMFIPDYLSPLDQENIEISWGDSIERNIVAYQTNAKIYGYIYENGENPSKAYEFSAWADSLGRTRTESDPASGYFELWVREGSAYNVWMEDDPEWGTPPPPGYVLQQNWRYADPGDTVYFNLVPASAAIGGTISFASGDRTDLDYESSRVTAWDSTYSNDYSSRIDQSNHYQISLLDGRYEVAFNQDNQEFLAMPCRYERITVSGDTVDTLNFELNYAHATVTVKLRGDVPMEQAGRYWINTLGDWPWVYQAGADIMPDSTYRFRVCEGEWYLNQPFWISGEDYAIIPSDTVLTVTENDSSFYIEFTYRLWTGLETRNTTPNKFYLNQNFPNPFNPTTTIGYGLERAGYVNLDITMFWDRKLKRL